MKCLLYILPKTSVIVFFWLLTLPFGWLHAQHIVQLPLFGKQASQSITSETGIQAVVVKADASLFGKIALKTKYGRFIPTIDEHYWPEDDLFHSNPIVFEQEVHTFELSGLSENEEAALYLMHLPEADMPDEPVRLRTHCEKPDMVYPAEWRTGLPAPEYNRIWNPVNNIILHHSATSNSLTNHLQLVRSIYTYHTEVNNWSDIGYNYLIANDGTIYAGRDPGELIHEDEVMGAHFCASNSGTMGVCILGTYTDTAPTNEALEALNRLLAWKTAKDSLPPHGIHPHPLIAQLDVIAAHRDGCATLCPGDAFITLFPQIRHNCNTSLEDCGIFLNINEVHYANEPIINPNPIYGNTFWLQHSGYTIKKVYLVDMKGGVLSPVILNNDSDNVQFAISCVPGIYLLHIETETRVMTKRIIKMNGH